MDSLLLDTKKPSDVSPIRFYAVVIVTCVALAFAAVIGTTQQLKFERDQALRQVGSTNQSRVSSFQQYVLRTLDLAAVTAENAKFARSSDELARLDRVGSRGSPFSVLFRIDRQNILSSHSDVVLAPKERAQLERISRTSAHDLSVSPPMTFPGVEGRQLALVTRSRPGEPFAVILIAPTMFTQFAEEFQFEPEDLISMIGLDGITRARRTGNVNSGGERVAGLVMERQRRSPNGSYIGPSVLDGTIRYFSHRRLPEYGLFVTSGRPISFIDKRIANRKMTLLVFLAFALVTIVAAGAAAIIYRRRRQIELLALVNSNRRLREAQTIGKIGDWDYHVASERLYWSEELLRMYGRQPNDNVTRIGDAGQYVRAEDFAMIQEKLDQVLNKGEPTSWDVVVRLGSGEESFRRVNAAPVFDENRRVVGVHGTDQDITAEMRVRNLEMRLAEVARLDAISALAATLAHELNQPLGVAMNYIGASLSRPALQEDLQLAAYLKSAETQLDHLSQIVTSAREFVTHAGNSVEEIDFSKLFAATHDLLKASELNPKATFVSEIQNSLSPVMANNAQLKQVLFNLGRNAIEAVPKRRRPKVIFRAVSGGPRSIRIEVEDNGAGFADFTEDPFAAMATSKPAGLGLGLSLARTIIEGHGGRIWIERSSKQGTVVAFTLETALH